MHYGKIMECDIANGTGVPGVSIRIRGAEIIVKNVLIQKHGISSTAKSSLTTR